MYKVNVFIDGERKYLFLVSYRVLVRVLIFLFLWDLEENMHNGKKETASITTFKKFKFADDFRIEIEDWKVLST